MKHFAVKSIFLIILLIIGLQVFSLFALAADDVIGKIDIPGPLKAGYGNLSGDPGGGLIGFASNLIKFIIILAGIWSFVNIMIAGFNYITQGQDPEAVSQAGQKIYMSLLGLVVIVGSFVLAAVLGWILFGDASAILKPAIYGPEPSN